MGNLGSLLQQAVEAKEVLKRAKEQEKILTEQLKLLLDEQGITKDTINGVKVQYITCNKSEIDEDKLLQIIKELSVEQPELKECICTKEYVDENALEELIYMGYITIEDIAPAYNEKSYKTLKLKRV